MSVSSQSVAVGLGLGLVGDWLLGDPRRGHPVAGYGALALALERHAHRDARTAGLVYALLVAGGAAVLGAGARRAVPDGVPQVLLTAVATWTVLGGTSLQREAAAMSRLLESGELDGARHRLRSLCGRDRAELDARGLARATVESVAENTSDAVVGPLFWGAVAGVPGLLAYRAVNTLDAMVGHRSPRYERFGWAAARTDDLANLAPARGTALLATALAPVVGGRPRAAYLAWRRDGGKHPSPNAGPVEAAFAGALGRTLGGRLSYAGRVEDRPLLGEGPAPDVADIARATRLSAAVSIGAGVVAVAVRSLLDHRRR